MPRNTSFCPLNAYYSVVNGAGGERCVSSFFLHFERFFPTLLTYTFTLISIELVAGMVAFFASHNSSIRIPITLWYSLITFFSHATLFPFAPTQGTWVDKLSKIILSAISTSAARCSCDNLLLMSTESQSAQEWELTPPQVEIVGEACESCSG